MQSYNCPIQMLVQDTTKEIDNTIEEALFCKIKQTIEFDINKEELIKALKYDRAQYEKGYNDGKRDASKVAKWAETYYGRYYKCSNCGHETEYKLSNYCPDCGALMYG